MNPGCFLGLEVEVESGLEPVELELAGGEEVGGPGGRGGGGHDGAGLGGGNGGGGARAGGGRGLAPRSNRGGQPLGLGGGLGAGEVTGEVACEQTSAGLVGGVEGVDEGVDILAVGAGGNQRLLLGKGGVGVELDGVLVEAEVAVGGVVGVDEGVEVGVGAHLLLLGLELLLLGLELGLGSLLLDNTETGLLLLHGLATRRGRGESLLGSGGLDLQTLVVELLHKGGGAEAGRRNVVAVQDPEALLAGGVPDDVSVSVVAHVGVLADAVAVDVGLFLEDDAVLGLEGGSGAAVAGVEALLLQNLGQLGLDLGGSDRQCARENDLHSFETQNIYYKHTIQI